ncbi:MAG: L-alanine-DL-glutamate epimerase-like enolase superfamily enzyme [Rhodothermales bacterium]
MNIVSVELIRAELPFHAPFRISISVAAATSNIFVRITTDTGHVGLGEASPSPAITGDTAETMLAAGRAYGAAMLGRDARDVLGAARMMKALINGHPTIRGGFDLALHDLASQAAGMPLYQYLGGARRSFETDNTVGLDEPAVMAKTAAEFIADGFPAIKAKVGTGFADDVARVRAIRAAIGPGIPLRIDANQAWDVVTSIKVLKAVAEEDVEYCEQPVRRHDLPGLADIRSKVSIPIMADESVFDAADALALVRGRCCDFLNIKLSKSAGIAEAVRIAAVAEAAGLACMVGCMSETRLGLTAAAHFISAHPIVRFADLDSHVDHTVDPVTGGMTITDGMVHVPDGPGLGAGLTAEFVSGCTVERIA